jgi:hypothetical protein
MATHLAGADLPAPGSADTVGINVFSGRAAPTWADEEVRRSVAIRAPETLPDNQELAHGPCQGSVSSAFSRAADDTDPLFRILES